MEEKKECEHEFVWGVGEKIGHCIHCNIMEQPKESWIEELLKIIKSKHGGLGLCDYMFENTIVPFIQEILDRETKKGIGIGYADAVEKLTLDTKKRKKVMGVSAWSEYGKKYGYWEYFKKEALDKQKEDIIEIIKNKVKNAPVEIQMTKGIIFSEIINHIKQL